MSEFATPPRRKSNWKKYAVVAAIALFAGMGIGVGSSGASTPEVETKIKTVTETRDVEVTPQACLDALDEAEQTFQNASKFAGLMLVWPDLVVRAGEAGMSYDVGAMEGIKTDIEQNTAEVEDLTVQVGENRQAFDVAARDCRG